MKKVILVDGNNLLFRSYYATAYTGNTMKNSKGFPTNAIYGFINMINKIISEEKPEYIMIAFDKGKTFRHDKDESYKGGRSETPEELKMQFPVAKQICEAMGIHYFEIDNYEADDIIGTFSKKVNENPDFTATIISSDKDLLQLITDEVDVKLLKQTGFIRMDRKLFKETYQVEPIGMIDLKALMGDASDNIPGVKGIGEKTAISLLSKYQTLDNLYNHIDEISGKTKEKLLLDKENAYMSQDIATIYQDVPINTDLENIHYHGINALEYVNILEDLEFYSLIKKLDIDKDMLEQNRKVECHHDELKVEILEDLTDFKIESDYALYLEILGTNYHKDRVLGVSIYTENKCSFIPFETLIKYPNLFENDYNAFTYDLKKVLYIFRKYAISLPVSKTQIVKSRYAFALILSLVGFAVALGVNTISFICFPAYRFGFYVFLSIASLGVTLLFLSFILPSNYSLGVNAGFAAMIIMVILLIILGIWSKLTNNAIMWFVVEHFELSMVITFVGVAILFVLSYALSVSFFKRKHT